MVKNTVNLGSAVSKVRSDPNMGNCQSPASGVRGGGGTAPTYNPNGTKAAMPKLGPEPAPHRKAG